MKRFYLLTIAVLCSMFAMAQDFDVISPEGVEMVFSILDEEQKTCSLDAMYVDGDFENDDDYVAYKNSIKSITIPPIAEGYKLTTINDFAFRGWSSLTSIVIPEGVTTIQGQAFKDCTALERLVIPTSVSELNLNDVLGYNGGKSLKELCIPVWMVTQTWSTSIGNMLNWFSSRPSITDLYVNAPDMEYWCANGFGCCYNLGGNYQMPAVHMMVNGKEVTEVVIPNSVTEIVVGAFHSLSEITKVEIPSSVTSMGMLDFRFCSSLREVTIPGSIHFIPDGSFSRTGLEQVIIPEGVDTLDQWAFDNCAQLKRVTLPSTLKAIGRLAFKADTELVEVTSFMTEPCEAGSGYEFGPGAIEKAFEDISPNAVLRVPMGCKAKYEAIPSWSESFSQIIEFDVNAVSAPHVTSESATTIYSTDGKFRSNLTRGLNIIRHKNNTITKVISR